MRQRPDDHLDPDQFDQLNEEFYRANPADYFRLRVQMLLVALGRSDAVSELLTDGVEWRGLRMATAPSPDLPEEESTKRLEAAGIADAEVIYHHVAECLLRLLVAHLGNPPCPWLELARLRTPGAFKERVAALLAKTDEQLDADLLPLIYGAEVAFERLDPAPSAEEVADARRGMVRWVRHFGTTWLGRAAAYNSAKHGFAISAGDAGFTLGPSGPDDFTLERYDPAISYLDVDGPPEDRRWVQRTTFVEPDFNLACAMIATDMIEQVWAIGHSRYVGTPRPARFRLFVDHLEALDGKRAERLGPFQAQGFDMHLNYLPAREEPSIAADRAAPRNPE